MSKQPELEARVWCPKCKVDKGEIQRIPATNEGVYTSRVIPEGLGKTCDQCATVLERKPKLP